MRGLPRCCPPCCRVSPVGLPTGSTLSSRGLHTTSGGGIGGGIGGGSSGGEDDGVEDIPMNGDDVLLVPAVNTPSAVGKPSSLILYVTIKQFLQYRVPQHDAKSRGRSSAATLAKHWYNVVDGLDLRPH